MKGHFFGVVRRGAFIAAALTLFLNSTGSNGMQAQAAQTAPGTAITNQASATYTDGTTTYNTTSNTVTTTVQNAPALTVTPGTGTPYSPGQYVTDTYTLTNNGNDKGNFQLTADATMGGTYTNGTLGDGSTSCSAGPCVYAVGASKFADLASLNVYLAAAGQSVNSGSSLVVSVFYSVPTSGTPPGTETSTATFKITQSTVNTGSAPSESITATAQTETNNIISDARIDVYKASQQYASSPPAGYSVGDIQYDWYVHDGGSQPLKDLASVKALLGAVVGGVFFSDRIPQFAGSPLGLTNSGKVAVVTNTTYGYPSTGTPVADVYYTTDVTGASGWTKATGASSPYTVPTSGVAYIGVFVHGGSCAGTSGLELCADTGHTTTPGNVNVASAAAIQVTFGVVQPTGSGSANTGSVKNLVNGVGGDNQPTEHIIGANVPTNTADGGTATALTTAGQGVNNTTQTSNNGDSNQTSDQAIAAYNVLNGPSGAAGSSGSYDGVAASSSNNDFTAYPFGVTADSIANTSATAGTPVTTVKTSTSLTICVPNTLQNSGNKNDTYDLTANVPTAYALPATSGGASVGTTWTVGLYSENTCTSNLGGAGDSTSASSTVTPVSVNSGSSLTYYVKYVVPTNTAYFTRFDSLVHAASHNDATKTNDTHDELYSSFIALTKSANVTSSGCPAGANPSLPSSDATGAKVCPGGTIAYTVDYRNLIMGTTDTNSSFAKAVSAAGTLQITDDGTTAPSTWFASSNGGIVAAPADKKSDGTTSRAATTWTYYFTAAANGASSTFAANCSKFAAVVGGSSFQLVPSGYLTPGANQDTRGTITFSITVQ